MKQSKDINSFNNVLVKPYTDTELKTVIEVEAREMNNNIHINILSKLKRKTGKCEKYGYVSQIYKITKKEGGYIEPENILNSPAKVIVHYTARIMKPIQGTILIGRLEKYNQALFLVMIGKPIINIIQATEVKEKFKMLNKKLIYVPTKKEVKLGQFVKIKILATKFSKGETRIITTSQLLDLATKEEVKEFYFDPDNEVDFDNNELYQPDSIIAESGAESSEESDGESDNNDDKFDL